MRRQDAGVAALGVVLMLSVAVGAVTIGPELTEPPTPTPGVVDSTTTTGNLSLRGLPVESDQLVEQTFAFQAGPAAPAGWTFPIRVEFQRYGLASSDDNDYIEVVVFNLGEDQPATVELLADARYDVVVQDANGQRRLIGTFVPVEDGAELTIVIGACCVDDFSREGTA